ncbi:MAG: DUF6553 family protein [Eubacterium sp.]|nr:DUF6553 family protein [Eubacterium sp.]
MKMKPWEVQYMYQIDRKERARLLKEGIKEEGMTPENVLRQKLFEARYKTGKEGDIDTFIGGWMKLYFMRNATKGLFVKRKVEKQKQEIMEDWQFSLAEQYGEAGEKILYQELFNAAKVYLSLCRKDKNYGSVFIGMGHMKEDKLVEKIASDIYLMAYKIPKETDTVRDFEVFTRAARDAFLSEYDGQRDLLLSMIQEGK